MSARKLARFWLLSVLTVAPSGWAVAAGPTGRTRSPHHRPLIAQSASKARPPVRRRPAATPPVGASAAGAQAAAPDASPATDLSASTPATPVSTPAMVASTPATPVAATTQVGAATTAPFTPLAAPPMTLWRFLGIPQGMSRLGGAALNRRGNFPGLEPKPPLKALADPANLVSDNKMLKKAALIKQQEDLKKQKIKALKYLATIGCGCYNRNPKEPTVQEAFIEGLKDCTEEVRYEAALQLANAAESKCEYCSKNCCCDANVMQVLSDIAVGRDENGCFNEPSARVREAACEALMACRRAVPVYPAPAGAAPVVPPDTETIPPIPDTETIPGDAPAPPQPNEARHAVEGDELLGEILNAAPQTGHDGPRAWYAIDMATAQRPAHVATRTAETSARTTPARQARLAGSVVGVDLKTVTVGLEFPANQRPAVGAKLSVLHKYAFELVHLGELEVVYISPNGRAIAQPVGKLSVTSVAKGDQVMGRFVPLHDSEVVTWQPAAETTAVSPTAESLAAKVHRPAIAVEPPAASDDAHLADRRSRDTGSESTKNRDLPLSEPAVSEINLARETVEPSTPASEATTLGEDRGTLVTPPQPLASDAIALLNPLPEAEGVRPAKRQTSSPAREPRTPNALLRIESKAAPLTFAKPTAPTAPKQTAAKQTAAKQTAQINEPVAPPAVAVEAPKRAPAAKPRSATKPKVAAIRFLSESTSATAIPIGAGELPEAAGVWAHD